MKMSRSIQRVANVLNSIGLITIAGILIWQSVERIFNPGIEVGYIPIISGLFAAMTNWAVAKVLYKVRDQNAPIHLAYIHNLSDVYVSLVPVLAGLLVILSHNSIFDPIIAIIIGIWLIVTTGKEIARSYSDLIWPENAVCKHDNELEIQKC
jgi:Co/Zn/Cd efflux system component